MSSLHLQPKWKWVPRGRPLAGEVFLLPSGQCMGSQPCSMNMAAKERSR